MTKSFKQGLKRLRPFWIFGILWRFKRSKAKIAKTNSLKGKSTRCFKKHSPYSRSKPMEEGDFFKSYGSRFVNDKQQEDNK